MKSVVIANQLKEGDQERDDGFGFPSIMDVTCIP
jgi:hypothetical protein